MKYARVGLKAGIHEPSDKGRPRYPLWRDRTANRGSRELGLRVTSIGPELPLLE